MPTREERAAQAQKSIGRMKAIFPNEIKETIASARIYNEGDGWNLEIPAGEGETLVSIQRGDVSRAVAAVEGKPCVLDPASFTKPAGSYEQGAWGPEAMLCASSNLYPILCGLKDSYYKKNKHYFSDGLCNDRSMYLTDVCFLHNGAIKAADVIVMAEPNRKRAMQGPRSEAECDINLKHRIQAALGIAAVNGCKTFVATAFGCGFNGNDPVMVAQLFNEWITEHPGVFDQVIFVLGNRDMVEAFSSVFPEAAPQNDRPKRVEENPEPVEEDEMADIPAPNENGVWVF